MPRSPFNILGRGIGGRHGPFRQFAAVVSGPVLDVAGLAGAYDVSDISTLFQDSAGTTPVAADGDPVGLMLDKSGAGNHATQATAAARPLYKIDSNGKPYLYFDGVDDYLGLDGSFAVGSQFWVSMAAAVPIKQYVALSLTGSTDTATNTGLRVRYDTASKLSLAQTGTALSSTFTNDGTATVATGYRDDAGRKLYANGSQVASDANTTAITSNAGFALARHGSTLTRMDFYGAVMRADAPTETELANVDAYLNSKCLAY